MSFEEIVMNSVLIGIFAALMIGVAMTNDNKNPRDDDPDLLGGE